LSKFEPLSQDQKNKATELFHKYDADKSGQIDVSEFKTIMHELKVFEGELASYYEDTVFQSVDKDHSGKIDLDEFLNLYARVLKNKVKK